ncbi:hypothetical protein SAY86_006177 [Trapa natans]|uniref:Uncharacterized protein n=1 Tax=Trapa natans TaxID=22666 RepID=A0AAN7L6U0_TRANT|nr:hypothetical protein SAY86_006177 [Trapa natans]
MEMPRRKYGVEREFLKRRMLGAIGRSSESGWTARSEVFRRGGRKESRSNHGEEEELDLAIRLKFYCSELATNMC